MEFGNDFARRRRQAAHQAGIKQIAVNDRVVFQHAAGVRVVHQLIQHSGQVNGGVVQHGLLVSVQLQRFK